MFILFIYVRVFVLSGNSSNLSIKLIVVGTSLSTFFSRKCYSRRASAGFNIWKDLMLGHEKCRDFYVL